MNNQRVSFSFVLSQKIVASMLIILAIMGLSPLQAQSQPEQCQFEIETPELTVRAAAAVMSGDYSQFVDLIDPKKKLPDPTRSKLSIGLEEFTPDGFDSCALLTQDNNPSFVASWLLLSNDETHLFLFLAVAKIEHEWVTLKVQVATDFDEIYSFVR
jgi:hypothetical protein